MKSVATMASLALAVAGVNFVGAQEAAPPAQRQGNEMQRGADRAGDRANQAGRDINRDMNRADRAADRNDGVLAPGGTAKAPDAEGIKDVLAQVAQASVTKDGFDDLVERFVDADRNRIGEWMKTNDKEFDDLNAKAKTLVDKFNAKYDVDEFDMDENEVFTEQFATITQSEIGDAARTAGSREGEKRVETRVETRTGDRDVGDAARDAGRAVGDAARDVGDAAGDAARNTGVNEMGTQAADANRDDPGRNIATVKINKSHGLPELSVEMIHEFPGMWKIDVPDQVTPDQLYGNLGRALDNLAKDESKWPADKNEAYRHISHKLLLAIYGKDTAANQPAGTMD